MFSGIFLDATADESRAEVVPQALSEVDTAAGEQAAPTSAAPTAQQREESSSTAQTTDADESAANDVSDVVNAIAATPLGDFIGITPFSGVHVVVNNPTALANEINGFVGTKTIILTNTAPMTLNPANITVESGANITILSGPGGQRTLVRAANDTRRHFIVNGTLRLGRILSSANYQGTPYSPGAPHSGVILCGTSTGNFSMTQNEVFIGGGIEVNGGRLILISSTIQNSAAERGGALQVLGNGNVSVYGGTMIRDNAATIHGGGIYLRGEDPAFANRARLTMQQDPSNPGVGGNYIINNRVEGRVWFDPVPLTPAAITALNNGTAVRNWYTANGIGGSDLTAPLPGRYDFPSNVSRGGGGIAATGNATVNIIIGRIVGNFAERGGGMYLTGANVFADFTTDQYGIFGPVLIADNSAHHSHRLDASVSFYNPLTTGLPGGLPAGEGAFDNFTDAHRRESGSGGGIHASGANVSVRLSVRVQVSRNISISQALGANTGGGGGIALFDGAHLDTEWITIGGTTPAEANMLSNWAACEPTVSGGLITGGCTPECHANRIGLPVGARNPNWSDLFPCANGHSVGYNRVGANRVGWGSARGANGLPIGHDGAGVFIHNASATFNNGTIIQHNRVCELGNLTSSSNGGGIAVHGANSVVNINGFDVGYWLTRITHNSAGWSGGGIHVQNGQVNLNGNSTIAYNMVNPAGNGAGVGVAGGTFTMNNTSVIRDHRYANTGDGRFFQDGGGIVMLSNSPTVVMNGNSVIENNHARHGGGIAVHGQANASPVGNPVENIPTLTMNNNAQIRGNSARNNGGGIALVDGVGGHGTVINMNNNAAIGTRAGVALNEAHRNSAIHGGGIFSNANGVTINMSTGAGAGTTAVRGNWANENGGGVLIGGGVAAVNVANSGTPPVEFTRRYPTLNIGAGAEITDNHARRAGAGTAGGGGGGIYVGNHNNDNSMAGVNLLGGTIARNQLGTAVAATQNTNSNGGGVMVRSQARGDNNTIASLDNHYGFRAVSGTISNNVAAPNSTQAGSGNGGGIFTISYLHRSPLANNPLFEVPFVTQAEADDYILRKYSNLNISADTIFANNAAARRSFPPLGDQLPHVQWNPATGSSITYGQMPAASPAYANPPAASTALYILNNFDINYIRPNSDFWFVKEDLLGNPLPGALFRLNLNTPTGTAAPGSPAGTPTNTAAGERISLENGLVGFPLALSRYGSTQNYALTEVEVRNADGSINTAVVIPAGHWTFNLPNRITNVTSFTNSIAGEPAFDRNTGVAGHAHPTTLGRLMWRVQNLLIQPATFSFFKTDMSIYDTPPNQSPPRLTGANFSLYRWTPQAGSAPYAASVTPAGIAAGHWTQVTNSIPSVAAESNAHIFDFVATSQDAHTWHTDGGTTIFHLVETTAPSGFDLPAGQWRFVLELDTTTGNAVTPGHDHIRPALAPSSLAPAFVQPRIGQSPADTAWYVGNVQMITPTGLFFEAARTPFVLTVCAVAFFFAARGAVHARKRIEELPMIVPIKRK